MKTIKLIIENETYEFDYEKFIGFEETYRNYNTKPVTDEWGVIKESEGEGRVIKIYIK